MDSATRRPRTDLPIAVIVVSALFLNGCHTMTRVAVPDSTPPPPNAAVFAELKPGDNVRLTLHSGEKVGFVLVEARADGLVGEGGRHIPYSDVAQLEKRQLSRSKTIWLSVGIVGGVALLMAGLIASSGVPYGFAP